MKYLLALVLGFGSCLISAQTVEVSSSAEVTNDHPETFWTQALGQDATSYYLLREGGPVNNKTIILEKYDTDMNLVFAKDIEASSGVMGDSKLHRKTELNGGKVLIFLEGWNKARGEGSFLVKEVNGDGSLADDDVVLETDQAKNQMKSASHSVNFSPDGSKLLVLTQPAFEKGEKEKLRLQVFSTDTYQSLWKQDLNLDNESKRYPKNKIAVNNAGQAYIFKDIKISGKEHIYQLITSGKDFSKTETIDLKTYYPTNHKMMINQEGQLVISGMLTELGQHIDNWQAIWLMTADGSGKIVSNLTEQLGPDLLRLFVSEKAANKPNYRLPGFVMKDVLLKPSGGILLITEKFNTTKIVVEQTTPPKYEHTLTHEGALVISFDKSGKRLWNAFLNKKQVEKTRDLDKTFGSFAYQLKGNRLYLVWNYTEIASDPPRHLYRYWKDMNGSKINIDNLYGREAMYPTLLSVINEDGSFSFEERTFSALPLVDIQKNNSFLMAVDPDFFFATPDGMVILSRMRNEAKRYKFNRIVY